MGDGSSDQTTITVSQATKDLLDANRDESWDDYLRRLHENHVDIVRIDPDQAEEIASMTADRVIEQFNNQNRY